MHGGLSIIRPGPFCLPAIPFNTYINVHVKSRTNLIRFFYVEIQNMGFFFCLHVAPTSIPGVQKFQFQGRKTSLQNRYMFPRKI